MGRWTIRPPRRVVGAVDLLKDCAGLSAACISGICLSRQRTIFHGVRETNHWLSPFPLRPLLRHDRVVTGEFGNMSANSASEQPSKDRSAASDQRGAADDLRKRRTFNLSLVLGIVGIALFVALFVIEFSRILSATGRVNHTLPTKASPSKSSCRKEN